MRVHILTDQIGGGGYGGEGGGVGGGGGGVGGGVAEVDRLRVVVIRL